MNNAIVTESEASGEDISRVCEIIEDVLEGCPTPHALMAMLTLILFTQNPNLTQDELARGVKEVSQFICLWMAGTEAATNGQPLILN